MLVGWKYEPKNLCVNGCPWEVQYRAQLSERKGMESVGIGLWGRFEARVEKGLGRCGSIRTCERGRRFLASLRDEGAQAAIGGEVEAHRGTLMERLNQARGGDGVTPKKAA